MVRYYVFFFSLAFDFKGSVEGENISQYLFISMTIISSLFIIMRSTLPDSGSYQFKKFGWVLALFLVCTFVVALIQGVELSRYLRVALPYFLLFLGYFVGGGSFYKLGFKKTFNLMLLGAGSASIFNVFYGMLSTGLSISQIRYQVLSPMLTIVIPCLLYMFFIEKQTHRKLVRVSLFLVLILGLISATRSWLVAYVAMFFLASVVAKSRGNISIFSGAVRSGFISIVSLTIAISGISLFMPEVVARVVVRIFSSQEIGFDITIATRLAEVNYQISAWLEDVQSFLIGVGLGSSYGFSGDSLVQLIVLFGEDSEITGDRWFAGHNFWVYSFYSQGLLLGWLIPYMLIYGIYNSWKGAILFNKQDDVQGKNVSSLLAFCFLVFSSLALTTIGGNPLGSRMLSQYIGIVLAMFFMYEPMLRLLVRRKKSDMYHHGSVK